MNTVSLTDAHLKVIMKALEVYFRLRLGQISTAIDVAYYYSLDFEDAKIIEKTVKDFLFKDGASYGVGSKEIDDANLAYEINKTFAEVLAVKNNNGYYGSTVDFHGPLKVTSEPLPKMLDFKPYKDHILNKRQQSKVQKLILKKDSEKMWEYIFSLGLSLPKGEKIEITYIDDKISVRVWKPRN